jgi:hypothetical protein
MLDDVIDEVKGEFKPLPENEIKKINIRNKYLVKGKQQKGNNKRERRPGGRRGFDAPQETPTTVTIYWEL